jgi:hypothetical protein
MWQASRLSLGATLAVVLSLGTLQACVDKVDACEEYDKFAETFDASCVGLSDWECATELPRMAPDLQQDFDWCVDCFRLRETEDPDLDCSVPTLGATPCGELLDWQLGVTCFSP